MEPFNKSRIEAFELLLRKPHRNQRLDKTDTQRLLQGTDHDQISDMDPVIAFLYRLRHSLCPDIVIDRGGGNGKYLIFVLLRDLIWQVV